MRATISILLGALLALAGCTFDGEPSELPTITPVVVVARAAPIAPVSDVVAEIPFDAGTSPASGVAVEPVTGRRLLLERDGVVRDLETGDVLWRAVAPQEPFGFTDVVALGDGQLALTSVSNGFLVELASGSMAMHFCYEPGWFEQMQNDPIQVSLSLARDAAGGRLYAQPRTIEEGGRGAVTGSFVAAYDEAGGADVAWWQLPDASLVAGGMIVIEQGALLLGIGSTLHRFDTASAELTPVIDLAELGIESIDGLARDEEAGTILVLDGQRSRVIELREAAIESEPRESP
ncbi:MAG: hypothetical protein M3Y87_37085 [Myxococcota bacterium]|nr:hypothetical protein [Myxococcota bacterium]